MKYQKGCRLDQIRHQMKVKNKVELCDTCIRAHKGGCPIWPTKTSTLHCVEYIQIGSSANSGK